MRKIVKRLTQLTIASGALNLAIAGALPAIASENPALRIRAVTVHGTRAAITVSNVSGSTQSGTIGSRVLVNGLVNATVAATVATQVTAQPGETVTVEVPLSAPVLETKPVGVVVDDGVPF